MIIGFVIWSMVAVIFLGIGISSYKAKEPVGFFTFGNPPKVDNVKGYNHAVAKLWFAAAIVMELFGLPFLFCQQNSPVFVFLCLPIFVLIITMIVVYLRIEAKYKKK